MPYATPESLIKRYTLDVLLSIARNDERQLDEPKVYEALEDASQTIDSYLAGRYRLPLNAVPSVLERHCCYIARYFLEKNRATDQARLDYEDSIRFLEKVASGAISLGLSDMDEPVETDNSAVMESNGSVWSRERSKGFI
ncbi:Mu-like prophage FluMu protein gp36 [Bibersteinia trehalosi USDA-ARS-USMARC-189]|uniref:Mu-like prophage FluMu protein gp36 n=1 Tax=Bibersteinia trehalosi USDA-ARS-USMARC-189 TaxID=1263831 RepID=A0ABM5PBP6_BIBTR|nr:phage protein Gp36 family protein [Bibersteinia trehalosi]AGH39015.1 Mu-like prophage FluMu protein gp36 [Bibersteinia trehalosi USDA-ARS-USMARC-192]AHG83451.1 Mu-like prophage FluMu protein gp36 [Bibersteinia trehalosi USDA-ARS-USMARC-189]